MIDTARQTPRVLSDDEKRRVEKVKTDGNYFINSLRECPPSRELSLAITNAEQAVMWAVKGITK
jgi:hypothetical protein